MKNITKKKKKYILLHLFLASTFIFSEILNTFNMELKLWTGEVKLPAGQQMAFATGGK